MRAGVARGAMRAAEALPCRTRRQCKEVAAILDEATWGVPSATRAAITAFTVDRHNAILHHVAQRASYHPDTLAWQSHFLSILANRENFEKNKIEPAEPRGFGVVSVYITKVRNSSPFNRNSSS